jgi:hypothetical protein
MCMWNQSLETSDSPISRFGAASTVPRAPLWTLVIDLVGNCTLAKRVGGCRPALYACTIWPDENSSQFCRRMSCVQVKPCLGLPKKG